MRRELAFLAAAIALGSTSARAQTTPKLWTQFETTAPHATVAGIACGLGANAMVEGRSLPIALDAMEDAAQICASTQAAAFALHGRVRMSRAQPMNVVVEIDLPPGATPRAAADLRAVLQNMSADLARRSAAAAPAPPPSMAPPPGAPVVPWTPPPAVPMHPEKRLNVPLVAGGFAGFGAGYFVQLLVGAAIAGAAGDPGTSRAWPFVPIFGLAVFSGTYQEAANCDCDSGRAFSMVGSVLLGLVEAAGLTVGIIGLAVPRTKMVPDNKAFVRVVPGGIEGRF